MIVCTGHVCLQLLWKKINQKCNTVATDVTAIVNKRQNEDKLWTNRVTTVIFVFILCHFLIKLHLFVVVSCLIVDCFSSLSSHLHLFSGHSLCGQFVFPCSCFLVSLWFFCVCGHFASLCCCFVSHHSCFTSLPDHSTSLCICYTSLYSLCVCFVSLCDHFVFFVVACICLWSFCVSLLLLCVLVVVLCL